MFKIKSFIKRYLRRKEISAWLSFIGVANYTLNEDLSVNVVGDVMINSISMDLHELPIKFKIVSGNFNCGENGLTTLIGCPETIGGYFDCHGNNIVSLVGCPISVGKYF